MKLVACVVAVLLPSLAAQGFGPDLLGPPIPSLDFEVHHPFFATDVNGDGRLDLLGQFDGAYGLDVSLQLPTGGFGPAQTSSLAVGSLGLPSTRTADFDLDGLADAVATHATGCLVRRSLGNGWFDVKQITTVGQVFKDSQVYADLSGDGFPDALLITVGPSNGNLVAAKGLGDGWFGGFGKLATVRIPIDMQSADLDADGDLDAVLLESTWTAQGVPTAIVSLINPGDGKLELAPSSVQLPNSTRISPPADVDADGLPDLLAFVYEGDSVQLVHNVGAAGFELQDLLPAAPVTMVKDACAADLDGDGYADLVVANGGGGLLLQRLARAVPVGDPAVVESASSTWRLAAADFDNDGLTDVAAVTGGTSDCHVLLNALGPFIDVGHGSPGGPTLAVTGQPSAGDAVDISLQPAGAPGPGVLLVGVQPLLANSPAGLIVPDPLSLVPLSLPASLHATWPAGLVGTPVTLQGVALGNPPHAGNAVVIVPEP